MPIVRVEMVHVFDVEIYPEEIDDTTNLEEYVTDPETLTDPIDVRLGDILVEDEYGDWEPVTRNLPYSGRVPQDGYSIGLGQGSWPTIDAALRGHLTGDIE